MSRTCRDDELHKVLLHIETDVVDIIASYIGNPIFTVTDDIVFTVTDDIVDVSWIAPGDHICKEYISNYIIKVCAHGRFVNFFRDKTFVLKIDNKCFIFKEIDVQRGELWQPELTLLHVMFAPCEFCNNSKDCNRMIFTCSGFLYLYAKEYCVNINICSKCLKNPRKLIDRGRFILKKRLC